MTAGRVNVADSLLLNSMGYSPEEVETKSEVPTVDEIIVEEVITEEVVAE